MSLGGLTPEDLDTLMEDAFVLRDGGDFAQLFEDMGVLVLGSGRPEARGRENIARAAGQVWAEAGRYTARPRRIVQCDDTALLVGDGAVSVARRGRDRSWRFAISLLGPG